MRTYWLKILLGAAAVFAVGMIGITLVRGGMDRVHSLVQGDGPITIPLGLVPFIIEGERLGKLDHVTLVRETPSRVSSVELEVTLGDSLLAAGLAGCRLAANLEGNRQGPGVQVRAGRSGPNAFWCISGDTVPSDLVEYGHALLQPGEVTVPLYLPLDLVTELQQLDFGHQTDEPVSQVEADSIAEAVERQVDSIERSVSRQLESLELQRDSRVDSLTRTARRFADSVRTEALRRVDSAQRARRVADTLPPR